jgi:nucleoid DNA-binding protein
MNLTQIIEETGKRIRLGKRHTEKLTNSEIKEVLEIALNVVEKGFQQDKRIEIQDFGVLEISEREVKVGGRLTPFGSKEPIQGANHRRRWVFRPARRLREALEQTPKN